MLPPFRGSRLRRLAAAALACAAAFGVAASPASAVQTKTLTYKCKYPLIGTNPLSVKIDLDIPNSWPGGISTEPFPMTAVATASGDTVVGLSAIGGVAGIEGVATATSTVTKLVDGASRVVNVPMAVPRHVLPKPISDPLVLTAAGSTPSLTFQGSSEVSIKLEKLALNLRVTDAAGNVLILPPLTRDVDLDPVSDSDGDPATFDVYCKLDAGQDLTLARFTVIDDVFEECEALPAPGEGVFNQSDLMTTSINVKWTYTDDAPVGPCSLKEFVIRYEGLGMEEVRVPASARSKLITGLGADSEYLFTISAVDNSGNESEPLEQFLITPTGPPPLPPITLTATPEVASVYLCWTRPTPSYVAYDIYRRDTLVGTQLAEDIASPCYRVYGLSPTTTYDFTVVPKLESGASGPAATVTATTETRPPYRVFAFDVAGSAQLNTLVKGSVPLKGGLVLRTGGGVPYVSGDRLTLAPTQARLIGLGFLPVTAKIAFVSSGSLQGSLMASPGPILSQQVRIKVLEAKLFGAIPLAGGNNCQTKSLTTLNLFARSFTTARGGTFTGTFKISDLNGCGPLDGLVSPVAAGDGNTISLNLTPKA